MTITKRLTKGSGLTYAEMDENIRDLYEDTDIDRVLGNGNTTTKDMTVGNIAAADLTVGNITANVITVQSLVTGGDGALVVPSGNLESRSANAEIGTLFYNTTTDTLDIYGINGWPNHILDVVYVTAFGRQMADLTDSSVTIEIPASTQEGDLLFMTTWTDDLDTPVHTANSSWLPIGNSEGGGTGAPVVSYAWYKIAEQSDLGTNTVVTFSGSDALAYAISVFRPVGGNISSVFVKNYTTSRSASTDSITLYTSTPVNAENRYPSIAVATLSGRSGQNPNMTWSGATIVDVDNDSEGAPELGYILFDRNSRPASSYTISTTDAGQQQLSGMHFEIR